jgi:dipeptidyl aminopeptidase/acylaminoacyl peptidase
MGGAIVLLAAEVEPEIAFVVADSSFQSLESILRERGTERYGAAIVNAMMPPAVALADLRCDMDVAAVSPVAAAARLKPPVFVAHSASDAVTKPRHSRAIYEAISHERRVLHVNDWGAAHGRDVLVNFEAYDRQMSDFLSKYAPGFGR